MLIMISSSASLINPFHHDDHHNYLIQLLMFCRLSFIAIANNVAILDNLTVVTQNTAFILTVMFFFYFLSLHYF